MKHRHRHRGHRLTSSGGRTGQCRGFGVFANAEHAAEQPRTNAVGAYGMFLLSILSTGPQIALRAR